MKNTLSMAAKLSNKHRNLMLTQLKIRRNNNRINYIKHFSLLTKQQ